MLGKLLKYEIKSTGRVFLPLYGVLVVVSIIISLLFTAESNMSGLVNGILVMLYFSLMVAIGVVTFVVIIQRFYKNLLTDEGYLMFTLPVKTWHLVTSKLLIAMLWSAVSSLAAAFSLFFIMTGTFGNVGGIIQVAKEVFQQAALTGINLGLIIFEFSILMLISLAANVLLIYAAIALGHIANRRQIVWSAVAYIGMLTILQIATSLVMEITDAIGLDLNLLLSQQSEINLVCLAIGIGMLVWDGACYATTTLALKKRLNLS